MTYEEKRENLLRIKQNISHDILSVQGVHGIGLRINENKIVVYVNEITPTLINQIPMAIEDIEIELVGELKPRINVQLNGGDLVSDNTTKLPFGTLGSWWFSNKIKKPVLVTNCHVLANNGLNPVKDEIMENPYHTLSIVDGIPPSEPLPDSATLSTTYTNSRYNNYYERVYWNYLKVWNGTSFVESTTACIGQYVLLEGWFFAHRTQPFYVNGQQITPTYTYTRAIIFKVPNSFSVGSTLNFKLLAKPSPVYSNYTSSNIIAELVDYAKINVATTQIQGYTYYTTECEADISCASPTALGLPYMSDKIIQKGAVPTNDPNGSFYGAGKIQKITGVVTTEIKENLPLVGTGYTLGTWYCHVSDAHYMGTVNYGLDHDVLYYDLVRYEGYVKSDGTSPTFRPGKAGCSGASMLVADINELLEFYNYYGYVPPTVQQMQDAMNDSNGTQVIFPNYFVGNYFSGYDGSDDFFTGAYGLNDKYSNWGARMNLVPLPLAKETHTDNINPFKTAANINTTAYLVQPDLESGGTFQSVSGLSVSANKEQQLEDFNLEVIAPVTDLNKIEFFFGKNSLIASMNVSGASKFTVKSLYKELIAQMKVKTTSSAKTTAHLFETILNMAAKIIGQTSVKAKANLQTTLDLQVSIKVGSKAGFNTTALIYEYIPGQQYETITFTIQRELVIECEITKSIDLNLAV